VLLGGGQSAVQGEHVEPVAPGQQVRGVPDLPLAGQEHQDVAGSLGGQLADRVADRLALVRILVDRPVPDLYRVGPAGHLDDRRAAEGGREPLGVDGRGGDDHLQVRAPGQQLPEVAEDEVDVQAALVRLVDDQRVVAAQVPVAGELVQQDAVGHQLHQRAIGGYVGEPDLVSDRLSQRAAELLGDPHRYRPGGQPSRLRVADLPVDAAAELQADLGDLGRLARPVSPAITTTWWSRMTSAMSSLRWLTGSSAGYEIGAWPRGGRRVPPRARQRAQNATWIARDARIAAGRARRAKTSQNSTPYRREG